MMRTIELSDDDEKELVLFLNDVIERRGYNRDPVQVILDNFSKRAAAIKTKLLGPREAYIAQCNRSAKELEDAR